MIEVEIFRNQNNEIYGFRSVNHGDPIVCSACSALSLNCVNSIDEFADCDFYCDFNPEGGFLHIEVESIKNGEHNHDVNLIFNCFLLGIKGIEASYDKDLKIIDWEV